MVFSSLTFLYLFLPASLALYRVCPARLKNAALLTASLLFYFYGEPRYTALLVFSALSDYLHARYIGRRRGTPAAKRALVSSIALNIAILAVFKYADLLLGAVNAVTGASLPLPRLPLPLGVSFFTFQTMSYTIDVYRGDATPERSLPAFAAYVTMFPQLVAGPIVRYTEVQAALHGAPAPSGRFARGAWRFCIGLGKKVLLANLLGELWRALAAAPVCAAGAWGMAVAFMLQIYFDFSGYSDMAIGLGALFGFDFPENFDYPYTAVSVTDFWRRWHKTLSRWFRDYLYIPLGGSRVSKSKHIRNLLLVWTATGLWHGARVNYALWGLYFALLLILEKYVLRGALARLPAWLCLVYTQLCVLLGFVLFQNESLPALWTQLSAMFGGAPLADAAAVYALFSYRALLLAAAVCCTPLPARFFRALAARLPACAPWLRAVFAALLVLVSTALLVDGSFNPFLYFRF